MEKKERRRFFFSEPFSFISSIYLFLILFFPFSGSNPIAKVLLFRMVQLRVCRCLMRCHERGRCSLIFMSYFEKEEEEENELKKILRGRITPQRPFSDEAVYF